MLVLHDLLYRFYERVVDLKYIYFFKCDQVEKEKKFGLQITIHILCCCILFQYELED
jgi:hypothetical protein